MYVPGAHGFLVIRGEALVMYAQSGEYDGQLEGGILWSSAGSRGPDAAHDPLASDESFPRSRSSRRPFNLTP